MLKKLIISIIMLLTILILLADYQSDINEAKEMCKKEGSSESEELVAIAACQYNYGKFNEALKSLVEADSMGLPEEYRIIIDLMISQLNAELGNYNRALIFNEDVIAQQITNSGSPTYQIEFQNLYYKYMLGMDITEAKKSILLKWEVDYPGNQYFLCEFLLLIEDYQAALQAITDYDILLKKHELTETIIQYVFYVHAYYELGNYEEAKKYLKLALAKNTSDYYGTESYLYYWDTLINYKLGNLQQAIISLKKGQKNEYDYHERFVLLSLWHFNDKNLKILEQVERLANNEILEK